MEGITIVLEKAALTEFSAKFVKEGYINIDYLLKKSEEALTVILRDDLDMGKGHIRMFIESLQDYVSAKSTSCEDQSDKECKS